MMMMAMENKIIQKLHKTTKLMCVIPAQTRSGVEWRRRGQQQGAEGRTHPHCKCKRTLFSSSSSSSSSSLLVQKLGQKFPVFLHNTECKARLAVMLPVSRIFFSACPSVVHLVPPQGPVKRSQAIFM